jgi:hypothetical protein
MKNRRFRILPILATVFLTIVLATSAVSAMPVAQDSGGLNADARAKLMDIPFVQEVTGDDPDETGYTGPMIIGEAIQPDPTNPDFREQIQPWENMVLDGEPDVADAKEPEWSDFYVFFAAGSALYSVDSAMGSNYNSGGCINATANPFDYFTIYLHLPQGSRIDYLRIYYYDTSGSNSTAYLNKYDGAANTTFLTEVSSAGNTGFGTQLSPYLGHIVDNGNGSYVLGWIPNVAGTSMQLCGLRVAYRLPF